MQPLYSVYSSENWPNCREDKESLVPVRRCSRDNPVTRRDDRPITDLTDKIEEKSPFRIPISTLRISVEGICLLFLGAMQRYILMESRSKGREFPGHRPPVFGHGEPGYVNRRSSPREPRISAAAAEARSRKKKCPYAGYQPLKGNQLSVKTGNESLGYDWVLSTRNSWPRDGHYYCCCNIVIKLQGRNRNFPL
jgi:hypothetical protein